MMAKLLIIAIIALFSCGTGNKVYLCNGPKSEVYHKIKDCRGLSSCSTRIEAVDIATAKAKHRRKCRDCFAK